MGLPPRGPLEPKAASSTTPRARLLCEATNSTDAMALATQAAGSLDGRSCCARPPRRQQVGPSGRPLGDRPKTHADSAAALRSQTSRTREEPSACVFLLRSARRAPDLRDRLDDFREQCAVGRHSSHLGSLRGNLSWRRLEGGLEQAIDDATTRAFAGWTRRRSHRTYGPLERVQLRADLDVPLPGEPQAERRTPHASPRVVGSSSRCRTAQIYRARHTSGWAGSRRPHGHSRCSSVEIDEPSRAPTSMATFRLHVPDCTRVSETFSERSTFCRRVAVERSSKTMQGEYLAWQALLYAAAREPEPRTNACCRCARVRAGHLSRESSHFSRRRSSHLRESDADAAAARLHYVIDSGIWDPVVIALRAAPELGAFLAGEPDWRSWLQRLLSASSDTSLANKLGLRMPRGAKRPAELTPRESEVHELLAQGLTNEEIAKRLYISLSTTKVHVKHIYEKLGVRSRLEAARALRDDV